MSSSGNKANSRFDWNNWNRFQVAQVNADVGKSNLGPRQTIHYWTSGLVLIRIKAKSYRQLDCNHANLFRPLQIRSQMIRRHWPSDSPGRLVIGVIFKALKNELFYLNFQLQLSTIQTIPHNDIMTYFNSDEFKG